MNRAPANRAPARSPSRGPALGGGLESSGQNVLTALCAHVVSGSCALREGLSDLAVSEIAGPFHFTFSHPDDGLTPLLEPGLDALIVDIGAGGLREIEFLRRAAALGPDAPVIAVGCEDPALQMAAIRAGAEDCLGADIQAPRALALAIRRAVARRMTREETLVRPTRHAQAEPQVTLVQESFEAIVILDSQGHVRFVNSAAEDLLGRRAGELTGRPFELPTEPGEHEIAVLRPDGDNRLAEMRIVETAWGGIPARVAALNDITVRRKLEHTMREAEEASAETRRRSRSFFSNVNHDLRTPLTHIIGFSEMMKNEQFGPIGQPRYRDYAQDIHSSGTMLLDMIEDLLGIAEAETEQIDLTNEICNLGQLIEIAATSQRHRAGEEGVAIEIDCPARLPGLRGDARRLRQGLFRLIAEAIHCMRRGTRLKLTAREDAHGILVTLAEEARAAAQECLPHLGEPEDAFVSAEGSGMARQDSLALSLTRKVMELHGGTLDVASGGEGPMLISLHFPTERMIR